MARKLRDDLPPKVLGDLIERQKRRGNLNCRFRIDSIAAWKAAAERSDMTFTAWVERALNRALQDSRRKRGRARKQ